MTRSKGVTDFLNRNARQLQQNLAKEECPICKRLLGFHSPEEFKSHALDDVTIELDIAKVPLKEGTGPCPNCEKPFNLHTDDEMRTCREALREWASGKA